MFEVVVSRLQKQDTKSSLPTVTRIFLLLFEYRSTHGQTSDHRDILDIEERTNKIFCDFAMKLSEISFKPLFTQVSYWLL